MKTICLNKKFYSIPEKWDELSKQQLLQVMRILFLKNYTAEQLLLKLLHVLTGMSTYRFFKCKVEELEEYFYLLVFLLKPDIEFTKNLIPSYQHSHTRFYGPSDHLDNLRMKEFCLIEPLFIQWFDSEKKDTEALDEVVAILYRPSPAKYDHDINPDGDHRQSFNQNISSHYAKKYISKWPQEVKLAIATWFDGCRRNIVNANPDVFEGGGDPARYGMVSVMLNIAESHVFGDFEKVEDQYVGLVMMQLNEFVDKARQLEKITPK